MKRYEMSNLNADVAEKVMGIATIEADYAGTYDGAFQVVKAMKAREWPYPQRFLSEMDRLISEPFLEPNDPDSRIAWPDALFMMTPEIVCQAALNVIGNLGGLRRVK